MIETTLIYLEFGVHIFLIICALIMFGVGFMIISSDKDAIFNGDSDHGEIMCRMGNKTIGAIYMAASLIAACVLVTA